MNKKIIRLILSVSLLTFSLASQAAFYVDDFTVETPDLIDSSSLPGLKSLTSNLGGSSDFSLLRNLSVVRNPELSDRGSAIAYVYNGELVIDTGSGVGSDTTSSYSNSAGFDFTVEEVGGSIFDTFVLSLLSIDQGGVDVSLRVDGTIVTKFVNTVGNVMFSHSLFGDLRSVNDIELFIHNNTAVDATFGPLMSFGAQTVPEPSTVFLLLSSLTVFGIKRYKAS